jgi:glycosyltransferase involved in cell wall biosynthesis
MSKTMRSSKPPVVVVVGQTPPPFHGQAIMIQMLLDGPLPDVKLHHVRMSFSDNMDQVGRFQLSKLWHLVYLIVCIAKARIQFGAAILYYPPAGPNRVPVFRDIVLLLSTRWMFRKTVFHFQASGVSELIPKLPLPIRILAQWAYSKPDVAIQLSPLTTPDATYFKARKICTVPNAAYDLSSQFVRSRDAAADTEPARILYVGTVCEAKGMLVLLDACSQLKTWGSRFHLDVVGSFQPSQFSTAVQACIEDRDLTEHVTIHGQKTGDSKWNMFANADMFCFPSHYESEGFPCVLVEAMCFSLPVVSTRWRGIPSIVEEDLTGYLVDTGDSKALALQLQRLILDPIAARKMGIAGRERFESKLSSTKHLEQMRQIFLELSPG